MTSVIASVSSFLKCVVSYETVRKSVVVVSSDQGNSCVCTDCRIMCVNKKARNVFNKSTSDVNEQGHCKPSLKRVTSESADLFHTARHCILCGFQLEDGDRSRLYVWKPRHFLNQSLIAVNPGQYIIKYTVYLYICSLFHGR